jgi:hypothetical protein
MSRLCYSVLIYPAYEGNFNLFGGKWVSVFLYALHTILYGWITMWVDENLVRRWGINHHLENGYFSVMN